MRIADLAPPAPPADLTIVGAGLRGFVQLTAEARAAIEGAWRVYYSPFNGEDAGPLRALNPSAEWLDLEAGEYRIGIYRPAMYRRLAGRVLEAAAKAPGVVVLQPGSAMVVDAVTRGLLEGAARRGLGTRVVAGISCIETVLAELRYDVADGLQIVLAQNLVLRGQRLDRSLAALVLQPGYYDTRWWVGSAVSTADRFRALQIHLARSYPPDTPMVLVLTPIHDRLDAARFWFRLGSLHRLHRLVSPFHTLFVPPVDPWTEDPEFRRRIDGRDAILAHVDRTPAGAPRQQRWRDWFDLPRLDIPADLTNESARLAAAWAARHGAEGAPPRGAQPPGG